MYAVVDIETNGGRFCEERIIEIGVYRFDGHRITDQLISMVNPEAEISGYVQKLTKITPKMVKTAPKFHEIAKRLVEITQGATLVGHNIEFDYRVIRQSFARLGYDFKMETIDTLPLSRKLILNEKSYSLGKLVRSLGIPLTQHHRAGGDARATLDLFRLLLSKDGVGEIIKSHQSKEVSKNYIGKINRLVEHLPHQRGVVYLQNAQGGILHLDYADDIHWFVNRFFNSKSERIRKLQEKVEQVQYELVGNHLLAGLVLASRGLKKNRSLPYGLYHDGEQFVVGRNECYQTTPVVKFRTLSQGVKVLEFINSNKKNFGIDDLLNELTIPTDALLLIKGRNITEKAFITVENNRITAYGFYELYTQVRDRRLIDRIKIPVKRLPKYIENELKLELLKGDAEVLPFPDK